MLAAKSRRGLARLLVLTAPAFSVSCGPRTAAISPVAQRAPAPYFGQAVPGETPVPFAAEMLDSLGAFVEATAFSPDGRQFFASVGAADYSTAALYHSRFVNGAWTNFVRAPFTTGFAYANEPVPLADGTSLTFTGMKAGGTLDLWTVGHTAHGWGTPVALPSPVNTGQREYRGSYTSDGTLYFGSNRTGTMQIYKANRSADLTWTVEMLGAPVNTNRFEGDPCIAPDGRFLIFYSGRDGRSSDLYVSFRADSGEWGSPVNLGPTFNSPAADEYGAHLSSDGKYLFYTRHTARGNRIYWVDTSVLDRLNPTRFAAPYLGQPAPGKVPRIFAPGVISKGNIHSRLVVSPDGREMYWNTVEMKTFSTQVWSVEIVGGKWSDPHPASFAMAGKTQLPVFSPDGKKLFFSIDTGSGWVTQYVVRTDSGWSTPRTGGFLPNGSASFTRSGRAYFSAPMASGAWNTGLFTARYADDGYTDIVPLDETINIPGSITYTPFVTPDDRVLLFSSNRPLVGDKEDMHIHMSIRTGEGRWSVPRRISDIQARFPSISPDGKYLFFCGDDGNIYWVDADIIDQVRPDAPGSDLRGRASAPAQLTRAIKPIT